MSLVTPSIGLIFWTTVVFTLLIILLKKFAWTPIINSVDERNKTIEEALSSANKAREEMEQLNADNNRILKEAREERDNILKEAKTISDKMVADAKEKASTNCYHETHEARSACDKEGFETLGWQSKQMTATNPSSSM